MPATLALMKAYSDGHERQRVLSYWSIGSWDGAGVSALFGGIVAASLGWRSTFWPSILAAIVSFLLIRETPALQSGLLTVGYLVAILSTLRLGEKLLRRMGPRRPMLIGSASPRRESCSPPAHSCWPVST